MSQVLSYLATYSVPHLAPHLVPHLAPHHVSHLEPHLAPHRVTHLVSYLVPHLEPRLVTQPIHVPGLPSLGAIHAALLVLVSAALSCCATPDPSLDNLLGTILGNRHGTAGTLLDPLLDSSFDPTLASVF